MSNIKATVKTTPFWGECILNQMINISRKEDERIEKERKERLNKVFEMIDDYIEQA